MKLLIGVDGSAGSFEAVAFSARLVDAARDQIGLYYSSAEILRKTSDEPDADMRDRARHALGEAVFAEARKRLPPELAKSVHMIVGAQAPARGLLAAADSWRADAIAVGARGLGPIQSIFLGSVSRKLVQLSTLPVLVVRPSATSDGLRLLLAYDRAGAVRQAEILNQFTWPAGTVGDVIRVVEPLLAGPLPAWLEEKARDADIEAMRQAWVSEHDREIREQYDEVSAFLARLPKEFRAQPPIVSEGHPADQILKTISEKRINLVIVGKTAEGAVTRLLVGSTSGAILNHAACSVLVIPPHETP